MSLTATTLEIEREGDILILKPPMDVLDLGEPQIEATVMELLEFMDHTDVKDVVLSLRSTHPSYSQTQPLSVALWKAVRRKGGSIAICFD